MSPVPLSDKEWHKINASLPDVSILCKKIHSLPQMEWLSTNDSEITSQLRLSYVCFYDASRFLQNARYALGQSIAIRRYFKGLSTQENDNNHAFSDIRSRFYADYVALLLYSTAEHTRTGIVKLFSLNLSQVTGRYNLLKTLNALEELFPNDPITIATKRFDDSPERLSVWKYRDDWVHGKPQRVETILYDPPRTDYIDNTFHSLPITLMGAESKFDLTWEELIDMLKIGLVHTSDFLNVCADQWYELYTRFNVPFD